MQAITVFWFRRDLRLEDNAGLYHALRSGKPVLPLFIFDTNILDELENKKDRRVDFILHALAYMQEQLVRYGSGLTVLHGDPRACFKQLLANYRVADVYTNHDYEPYAMKRDTEIVALLLSGGINFHSYKDQVVFEKDEVVKDNGEPYTVFTPYSKKWKQALNDSYLRQYPTDKYYGQFFRQETSRIPSLPELRFEKTDLQFQLPELDPFIASHYDKTRDIPAINGTTRLSEYLRFGTISIRKLVAEAMSINETLVNELIWREFYQMILWHFPHVVNHSFRADYDNIKWRNDDAEFEKWYTGQTGYPIVDAGIRELNATGFMHNRVRMITASFLTKHLLIDWRWGEAYFAKKLLDYDLASNNGNWQWTAGCGCDAAPYFRIFNPYLQAEKFDPEHKYIKKWVPEYQDASYPKPMIEHKEARARCLAIYKAALNNA